jgi:hypothetical protein
MPARLRPQRSPDRGFAEPFDKIPSNALIAWSSRAFSAFNWETISEIFNIRSSVIENIHRFMPSPTFAEPPSAGSAGQDLVDTSSTRVVVNDRKLNQLAISLVLAVFRSGLHTPRTDLVHRTINSHVRYIPHQCLPRSRTGDCPRLAKGKKDQGLVLFRPAFLRVRCSDRTRQSRLQRCTDHKSLVCAHAPKTRTVEC